MVTFSYRLRGDRLEITVFAGDQGQDVGLAEVSDQIRLLFSAVQGDLNGGLRMTTAQLRRHHTASLLLSR